MDEAEKIVIAFNDCITRRDLRGLEALMTDDHRFVDPAGGEVRGKAACVQAWRGFFSSFPDYRNIFETITASPDGAVVALGYSECADERLHGTALWSARVVGDRLGEWRVHDDTPENRAGLGL